MAFAGFPQSHGQANIPSTTTNWFAKPAGPLFGVGTGVGTGAGGQPSQSAPLFGLTTTQPAGTLSAQQFAAFNQQSAQQQPTFGLNTTQPIGLGPSLAYNPHAPDAIPTLTNATKFNDLPAILQDLLNDIENLVQSGSNIAKDLKTREFGQEIVNNATTGRQIFHDLSATTNTLVSDDLFAKDLRNKIDQAVQDVIIASRIVDGFKDGQQNAHLKNHAQYPLEFFSRITEQMAERIQRYRAIMEQVERKLASSFQSQQTPQAIAAALQSQNASFMALTVQVAEVHSELEALKAKFKARVGGTRDPFARVS